ncbi:reactive mitochondrial oxygen species modulator 1-domain-containing protein [Lentinula novae-zelandiae]|nr:reactive mitochondrial oxygen species modulator 1-domain-containing protein [Lentinula novae-zelandiae]
MQASQPPSTIDKLKMGAMMGGTAGLAMGFLFGSWTIMRYGPGPNGAMATLSKYMLNQAAFFGFFFSVGSVSYRFHELTGSRPFRSLPNGTVFNSYVNSFTRGRYTNDEGSVGGGKAKIVAPGINHNNPTAIYNIHIVSAISPTLMGGQLFLHMWPTE